MKISKNITLPDNAVTQTYGFIARKGGGKTYASTKLCELFLERGVQCIALDPVGNWYGLRLDKSGKKPSKFNILILGGEHGDIPLDYKSGAIVANFLLDSGASAVLDVSSFRKGQRKEFVADFAEELFHRQKARRIPLHLFVEEAQVFIPQRPGEKEQRMLGAMEDIVRLGRNYGIGVSLNSQRPQSVNKEVLNQVEPLIVFQLTGSHERKAINEWVSYAGAEVKEQLSTLPSLPNGQGFFWSPAWLRKFEPIQFLGKKSFDASATPEIGDTHFQPKPLSKTSLDDLSEQMQVMVKKAAENDPAALKRKIKGLERRLTLADRGVSEAEVNRRIQEALNAQQKEGGVAVGTRSMAAEVAKRVSHVLKSARSSLATLEELNRLTGQLITGADPAALTGAISTAQAETQPTPRLSTRGSSHPVTRGVATTSEHRVLQSIAWWRATGAPGPYSKVQIAVVARYKPGTGNYNNILGKLKAAGLIDYPQPKYVDLTDAGVIEAGQSLEPGTQEELHEKILAILKEPQKRVLMPILQSYPGALTREEVAAAAGYTPGTGNFNNLLGQLRSLQFIDYPESGHVVASDDLFLE